MMNKPMLDLSRGDAVIVGGRLPLYYMQLGHGFTRTGVYLGECDEQGVLTGVKLGEEDTQPDGSDNQPSAGSQPNNPEGSNSSTDNPDDQTQDASTDTQEGSDGSPAEGENQPNGDDDQNSNPDPEDNTQDPNAVPGEIKSSVTVETYKGVRETAMRKEIEDLGLDMPESADRDEIIGILVNYHNTAKS